MSFLVTALALFLPAGTIAWPAGWICLILVHGWLLVGIGLLLKYNPGLLQERLSFSQTNQKAWVSEIP
jgi:threonine/homoserine/homoserine lactone efflux protein